MARFRVRTKQFCQLSQEQKWQSWLQSVAPDLYDDLMSHLKISRTCRSNHTKMMDIQKKLNGRKLMIPMVNFLRKEYPYAVEQIEQVDQKETQKFVPEDTPPKVVGSILGGDVFRHYSPNMLTFPQKAILENEDQKALQKQVREFVDGKVGVDYIIIGTKAYIEYFKLKYNREASMVPDNEREIYLYRLKNGLGVMERLVKQDANIG